MNVSAHVSEHHIARSALEVELRSQTFDLLVPCSAARAHRRIGWNRDVVIDRNIAHVHIINVDAVAALPNGWILLEFTDIALASSLEPPVTHVNLPVHRHSSCRTAADSNVPRTHAHLEINRPANLKCSLE